LHWVQYNFSRVQHQTKGSPSKTGYQKLEPPKPEEAVVVGINIEILDILGVNDKVRKGERVKKQAMAVFIYIERSWTSLESMTR
jgi:hypothetical protein